MISQFKIQEFMEYFAGSQHNFGEHIYDLKNIKGQKREGRSSTIKNKLITIKNYEDHLSGRTGLGIIPINSQNQCKFTVIDVDLYNFNFAAYLAAIDNCNLPIVPCRSKSGGLHLYTFYREWTSASKAIKVAKQLAFLLSIDSLVKNQVNRTVEIFPKQSKLAKGNIGSWINLPYFDAGSLGGTIIKQGKPLNLDEALYHIKDSQVLIADVEEVLSDMKYKDAPPCLQLADILNSLELDSGRNNYLFSFGVYLKKKTKKTLFKR